MSTAEDSRPRSKAKDKASRELEPTELSCTPTDLGGEEELSYVPTDLGREEELSYVATDAGNPEDLSYVSTDLGTDDASDDDLLRPSRGMTTTLLSLAGPGRVGIYELHEELGRGGMGVVYRAWHPIRRRDLALKIILPASADGEEFESLCDLFMREGAILMSMSHPNVVRCYDCNVANHDGRPILYMALELLSGRTLAERLDEGRVPVSEAIGIAREIASALEALHTNTEKILHRDVKAANVFLTDDGNVKLLDFGLAGVADWRLTQVSLYAAGSRPYMSPEQFDGLRYCTERSDLYSLGITLFEMVAGVRPFQADTDQGFIDAHVKHSPPTLLEACPELEETPVLASLQNSVSKLLAKKTEERYDSASELLDDLHRIEVGEGVQTYRITTPEWERRKAAIKRAALFALTLLIVSVAVVFGYDVYRRDVRNPGLLREAEAAVRELRFSDARAQLEEILASDHQHEGAQSLEAHIVQLTERRGEVERFRKQANAERDRGDLLAWSGQAERVHTAAVASGVFTADEIAEIASWKSEAHRRRAESVLQSIRGDLEDQLYNQALSSLDSLDEAQLDAELRGISGALLALGGAGVALVSHGDPIEALRLADISDTEFRKIPGRDAEELAWLVQKLDTVRKKAERVSQRDAIELAAEAAERGEGDWDDVHGMAQSTRRRLLANVAATIEDPTLVPRLEKIEEQARAAIFENSINRAESLLENLSGGEADAAKAREAAEAARHALRHLPETERRRFAELARAYETDRKDGSRIASTEQFREHIRRLTHAEPAWLALEEAEARAALEVGERFVPRTEGVTLGEASPYRMNPSHVVSLAPFYLDQTELRCVDYADAVTRGVVKAPEYWGATRPPEGSEGKPVRDLSFADAMGYARSVGKRLPSPDEWELAASVRPALPGGPHRVYPWGENWVETLARELRAVGSFASDTSARGFLDMGGNVTEWTAERRGEDSVVPCAKGGSYLFSARVLPGYRDLFRSTHRNFALGEALPFCGFRCARDVPMVDLAEFVEE